MCGSKNFYIQYDIWQLLLSGKKLQNLYFPVNTALFELNDMICKSIS